MPARGAEGFPDRQPPGWSSPATLRRQEFGGWPAARPRRAIAGASDRKLKVSKAPASRARGNSRKSCAGNCGSTPAAECRNCRARCLVGPTEKCGSRSGDLRWPDRLAGPEDDWKRESGFRCARKEKERRRRIVYVASVWCNEEAKNSADDRVPHS